jgi:hypothetical protein
MGKKRQPKSRKRKNLVAVVYEAGKDKTNTERDYFLAINKKMTNDDCVIKLERIKLKHGNNPKKNIEDELEKATDNIGELDENDKLFICCDADILGDYEARVKRSDLLEVLWHNYHHNKYGKSNSYVIIWNICIETWFLMHLDHVNRQDTAEGYLKALQSHSEFRHYTKTNYNFTPMLLNTKDAVEQSKKQFIQQNKKGYSIFKSDFNPGTNMHEFFEVSNITL